MPFSDLAALSAKLHAEVNDALGERVRIEPEAGGTFGTTTADGTRTMVEITGVFLTALSNMPGNLAGDRAGPSFGEVLQAGEVYLRITTADAAAANPRKGDVVTMLDRGNEKWQINRVAKASSFRTNIFLER